MRLRDQELYHARKQGYRLWGALNGIEIWAHPDDPRKYRIVPANPETPPFVFAELLKLYDDESDENGGEP